MKSFLVNISNDQRVVFVIKDDWSEHFQIFNNCIILRQQWERITYIWFLQSCNCKNICIWVSTIFAVCTSNQLQWNNVCSGSLQSNEHCSHFTVLPLHFHCKGLQCRNYVYYTLAVPPKEQNLHLLILKRYDIFPATFQNRFFFQRIALDFQW